MSRLGVIVLLLAAAGCGVHLGDGYGRRTRAALDAQFSGRNEGTNPIDGGDAKVVMTRHRGTGTATSAVSSSSGSYGIGQGANAPIIITPAATAAPGGSGGGRNLDAVR